MRQLNHELHKLTTKNRDGAYATQAARSRILAQCANELHELGYRKLSAHGLKQKHVDALVSHWIGRELSSGTIKNRMAHVRWWAEKIGKSGVVRQDNEAYGIQRRQYVNAGDKSRTLDQRLKRVNDPYVLMSLKLQAAFGLRREEAIKFQPQYADRGDRLVLKDTWTKGGKPRDMPIRNDEQRAVVREAHLVAGRGSLIPPQLKYVQQLKRYEDAVKKAGFSRMHGLRHTYAQQRYKELTGRLSPIKGGPRRFELSTRQKAQDDEARLVIGKELGHERIDVVGVYVGT